MATEPKPLHVIIIYVIHVQNLCQEKTSNSRQSQAFFHLINDCSMIQSDYWYFLDFSLYSLWTFVWSSDNWKNEPSYLRANVGSLWLPNPLGLRKHNGASQSGNTCLSSIFSAFLSTRFINGEDKTNAKLTTVHGWLLFKTKSETTIPVIRNVRQW